MRQLLVVIDMQEDFINGALGTPEAQAVVPQVIDIVEKYQSQDILLTQDTHGEDYLQTQEGRHLPIPHCIVNTPGWEIQSDILEMVGDARIFTKPTFGSTDLAAYIQSIAHEEPLQVTFVGVCTDICVLSNALLVKALCPEIELHVIESACAGTTPERHQAAIESMRSCQILID